MKNMSLLLFMALSSAYLYADADELRKQVQSASAGEPDTLTTADTSTGGQLPGIVNVRTEENTEDRKN
ncbi:MAG: hypothetical protein CMI02_14620 [Oceanospirillaceae bacterium]|nr:hypothetical protein [Oceanospirillaceae bacterium]MBT13256.1 hypothetical protein [Oceanospirillaceae bacterium]|tara:strand:+ start:22789 stop:22992 length:204 start_codon:yes stop_codon:yes gene_type:complete